jgi:predicted Holliday junction resolvase-like endonuclease
MMENPDLKEILEQISPVFEKSIPVLTAFLCIAVVILLFAGIIIGRLIQKAQMHSLIKKEREDAVRKSRAVLGGQFSEQMAPFMPRFPCNPGDAQFLGNPVDYVAFKGSAEGSDITDIIFIEVKTGKSTLSAREKQIRDAIRAGRVHFVEYRLP